MRSSPDGTTAAANPFLLFRSLCSAYTSFALGSRPFLALLKRYHAGPQIKAAGELTFGQPYLVDRTMPLVTRVWRTTLNWLDANRVGMNFSFLFGPAALTFLATLRRRRTNSRYLNTLLGTVAGVPLAVCTNCVAPMTQGFLASGMSDESVLATMFASPALNVVVLAMTFALFPVPVALLSSLRCFSSSSFCSGRGVSRAARRCFSPVPSRNPGRRNVARGLLGIARSYARGFWHVFRIAFPLMLLAAFLGALLVELLPAQALFAPVTVGGILLVALIAAFLPVPMAFDVAIAYVTLTRGVPLPYVVTILCTLGIVSVYSLSIVGKSISWKVAIAAYATVAALGTAAGLLARSLG